MSFKDLIHYELSNEFAMLDIEELLRFQSFVSAFLRKQVDPFWMSCLHQTFHKNRSLFLNELLSVYNIYKMAFSGELLFSYIWVGMEPSKDQARERQQSILNKINNNFSAIVYPNQKTGEDGRLVWEKPIHLIKYTGDMTSEASIIDSVFIPPGDCPLEIGYYDSIRLYRDLSPSHQSQFLARFPYGHSKILLLHRLPCL